MGKVVLTLLALGLGTATASAQAWAEKMFKDGDKLVLNHDFGTVPLGSQLTHSFKVHNIYAVKMEITDVKVGCGCVLATAAKRVLEPHESTTIDMKLNTTNLKGPKTVVIRVTVGPQFISSAELRVSVIPRMDIVLNPGEINFGLVTKGQPVSKTMDVEYAGASRWEVQELLARDLPYVVSHKEIYRKPGRVGYRLQVTMRPDAPTGALRHYAYLKTNDPTTPTVPVLIEANVQPLLSVAPSTLNLGTMKAGTSLDRRVVVRGVRPFRISKVEGTGDGIELGDFSAREDFTQIVTFKCKLAGADTHRRELKIYTTLQNEPVIVTIEGVTTR